MADSNNNKIEFVAYHQPVLPDGDYQIKVKQYINFESIPPYEATQDEATQDFTVSGPRFTLGAIGFFTGAANPAQARAMNGMLKGIWNHVADTPPVSAARTPAMVTWRRQHQPGRAAVNANARSNPNTPEENSPSTR